MELGLGYRLRNLRGMATQKDVASALGVSNATISSWESGHAIPPEHRLSDYARWATSNRVDEQAVFRELITLREGAPVLAGNTDLLAQIRDLLIEIRDRLPLPDERRDERAA